MDTMTKLTHPSSGPVILEKGAPRSRVWVFTLNNWTEDDLTHLTHRLKGVQWGYGKEVGEGGTPHLQGWVQFPNQVRLTTVKEVHAKAHWETARKPLLANRRYCAKDGDYTEPNKVKIIDELRPWQYEVEKIVLSPPDDRSIYWFWEPEGNVGKTALIKYLLTRYEFCTFTRATKSADILTIADPKYTVYLFDFARSQQDFEPWLALEQLKDGLISDSKLKKVTRNIVMNPPTIIIFANWECHKLSALSKDKLIIKRIES